MSKYNNIIYIRDTCDKTFETFWEDIITGSKTED